MELLDIYDINHRRTGRTLDRSRPADLHAGERLLVCHLCLFNPARQMLVQKRSPLKSRYPDSYDLTAGGFVQSGETSEQAILRETGEELGLYLREADLYFYKSEPFSVIFDDLYLTRKEIRLSSLLLQAEEVSSVTWMNEEEILRRIGEGSFVDYETELIRELFRAEEMLPLRSPSC